MIQRIVRKALWGLFFCFFENFFVSILTSGGYVGLSIATLLSQHHKVMERGLRQVWCRRSLRMSLYMMAGALWYGSNMSRAFRML